MLKSHARQHFWYVRKSKLYHLHRRSAQAPQVAEVPRAPTLLVRSRVKIRSSASTICTSAQEPPRTTRNNQEPPGTNNFLAFYGFSKFHRYHVHHESKVLVYTAIPLNSTIRGTTMNNQEQPETTKNHQEPPGSIDDLHKRPRSLKSHARQHFWYVRLSTLDHLYRRLQASQVAEIIRAPTLLARS